MVIYTGDGITGQSIAYKQVQIARSYPQTNWQKEPQGLRPLVLDHGASMAPPFRLHVLFSPRLKPNSWSGRGAFRGFAEKRKTAQVRAAEPPANRRARLPSRPCKFQGPRPPGPLGASGGPRASLGLVRKASVVKWEPHTAEPQTCPNTSGCGCPDLAWCCSLVGWQRSTQ